MQSFPASLIVLSSLSNSSSSLSFFSPLLPSPGLPMVLLSQNARKRRSNRQIAMRVDVAEFRSFCFRGEGRANIVISAKHRKTGNRIVWRFAKTRKSGELSVKGKSLVFGEFMEKMISPLLHPSFLVEPRTVDISIDHAHQLAKLPCLKSYDKIESLSDLEGMEGSLSLLQLDSIPPGQTFISCLEMLDATCIPRRLAALSDLSTVTLEIKPKQGYYQAHPGMEVPYCNNCILQIEKCRRKDALYSRMYDFCPLSLFSDDLHKQRKALESLISEPHRNLRVFVDGSPVLSDESLPSRSELQSIIYPNGEATVDDLLEGVLSVLNGRGLSPRGTPSLRGDSPCQEDCPCPSQLPRSSPSPSLYSPSPPPPNSSALLKQLLKAQRIDVLGLVKAHQLFFSLSAKEQAEVGRKVQSLGGLSFLSDNSAVSLLKRYLLAATLKDCSVMISLRLIRDTKEEEDEWINDTDVLVLPSGKKFAYSAKIVDLDPKSPKNMVSAYKRLKEGVDLLREGTSRPPCVQSMHA